MARGFAGETAEQESRGPGPSASAVSAAEGDAIGSAMSSAMGFGPNDGSDDEDFDQSAQQDLAALATRNKSGFAMGNPNFQLGGNYNPVTGSYSEKMSMPQFLNIANTRTKNLTEARSTLGRLQGVLGPGNAITQDLYNGIMGISNKNPYGHGGVFSSLLGIDPKNIDYTQTMGRTGVARVAQAKYNRYKDYSSQDPQSQKRGFGSLFGGPVGEMTSQGPVAQQVDIDNIPIGDALATQAASFGLGPFGLGLMEVGDPFSTYVPKDSAAYRSEFDPAVNKDLPSSTMGQAARRTGLGIEQLVDSVTDFFKPEVPEPVAADVTPVTTQPNRTGFEERRSDISNMYPNAGNYGSRFGAGEQLAGNLTDTLEDFLFEQFLSDEAKEALREKGISIDQISPSADPSSFPITPAAPEPPPDIMQMIKDATRTSELGGPSTANQVAMLDFSNLFNVGNDMYRSTPDPSFVDKALDKLGIRALPKRSKGQIKSSTVKSEPLFDLDRFNLFSGS